MTRRAAKPVDLTLERQIQAECIELFERVGWRRATGRRTPTRGDHPMTAEERLARIRALLAQMEDAAASQGSVHAIYRVVAPAVKEIRELLACGVSLPDAGDAPRAGVTDMCPECGGLTTHWGTCSRWQPPSAPDGLRAALEQAVRDMERAHALLETLVSREGVSNDAANRIPHAQIVLMGAASSLRAALGSAPRETSEER